MRVKATDIARELGISKATVSLALNNKPRVKEETRKAILECKKRLEENGQLSGIIKSVVIMRGLNVAYRDMLDLWTDVDNMMSRTVKSWGCSFEISFFDILNDSPEELAKSCNQENVAGVLIQGVEMQPGDEKKLAGIKKPLIISDMDVGDKYPCVVFNSKEAIEQVVERLASCGRKNILYLARNVEIYNYLQRREGFCIGMEKLGLAGEDRILKMGITLDDIYENLTAYLQTHSLPDAFIMENYHLSIVTIRAFQALGIEMPRDVGIVGVDEIPEYLTGGYRLSTIRVPHMERGKMLLLLLRLEIEDASKIKSKVFVNCEYIKGNTLDI